jgi:hypothetical protein
MPRYKVNLVHFVEADYADQAIAIAQEPGRKPIIGEAFLWRPTEEAGFEASPTVHRVETGSQSQVPVDNGEQV